MNTMILGLGGLLIVIFLFLSAVHFYWAFGGKWGFQGALPTNEEGVTVLNPKTIDSVLVGFGLLLFAFFYCIKTSILSIALPNWFLLYGGWALPAIFLLRAIGDTTYVGVFKKIKSTEFAKRDTRYFIPFCAFLALVAFIVQIYS